MYDFAMVDPPWLMRRSPLRLFPDKPRSAQSFEEAKHVTDRALAYQTLSLPDIEALLARDIWPILAAPCTVWLWTTEGFLAATEALMQRAGFRLHLRLIWDKGTGLAPCYTARFQHQYCLWYYRSPFPKVAQGMGGQFGSVIRTPQPRHHSEKPQAFYDLAERCFPEAARLDAFARRRRPGWVGYGDELDYFPARSP